MSSTSISIPLGEGQEEPIALAPRILHRFYEPVMMLASLIEETKDTALPWPPEGPIDTEDTKQVFHAFANKLAHIFDSAKGGSTITSFMVLKGEGSSPLVHYWFAVNKQTGPELETTAAFVKKLLNKIGKCPADSKQQDAIRKELLYDVLRFNRPRTSVYLRMLQG